MTSRSPSASGDTMSKEPVGYGHDKKGAAGGDTKVEGRPNVAHTGPADKVQGEGSGGETIAFTLDGIEVEARKGETIWQVAQRQGTDIPHLCYAPEPGYRPDGNCRACMVEIEGERVLAASCIRTPSPGMKVKSASDRARTARKMVFELLISDQPDRDTQAHDPASKFWSWADRMGIATSRLPSREWQPAPDRSHVAMAVNLDACIQCNLCVRACREVQVNDVIGMAGRGHGEKIVFDFDDPMGESTCVACGECVQACPTGPLLPATLVDAPDLRAPRRGRPQNHPRPRRLQGARRLRLGQGLERGGLSLPEARARRLRHQQCRSLHAALPRFFGGRAAGDDRFGGGDRHLQRVQEFRR